MGEAMNKKFEIRISNFEIKAKGVFIYYVDKSFCTARGVNRLFNPEV